MSVLSVLSTTGRPEKWTTLPLGVAGQTSDKFGTTKCMGLFINTSLYYVNKILYSFMKQGLAFACLGA